MSSGGKAARTWATALRRAARAWSLRSYEARLFAAALLAALVARWAHLSALWAIISAILVMQPDPVETRRNSVMRFVATLIGGVASVGAVLIGLEGLPAFLLALAVTCTLCAGVGLEEGLRPACVCTAVLLIRPESHVAEAEEFRFALQRILAVLCGGVVALTVAYLPGWNPKAGEAARGQVPDTLD
ncbi:MAG TPA: FUSC family protein [Myxococcaceae bacterium]|nr:FUSC family protein [Myxococcaceae bacterium]